MSGLPHLMSMLPPLDGYLAVCLVLKIDVYGTTQ